MAKNTIHTIIVTVCVTHPSAEHGPRGGARTALQRHSKLCAWLPWSPWCRCLCGRAGVRVAHGHSLSDAVSTVTTGGCAAAASQNSPCFAACSKRCAAHLAHPVAAAPPPLWHAVGAATASAPTAAHCRWQHRSTSVADPCSGRAAVGSARAVLRAQQTRQRWAARRGRQSAGRSPRARWWPSLRPNGSHTRGPRGRGEWRWPRRRFTWRGVLTRCAQGHAVGGWGGGAPGRARL